MRIKLRNGGGGGGGIKQYNIKYIIMELNRNIIASLICSLTPDVSCCQRDK